MESELTVGPFGARTELTRGLTVRLHQWSLVVRFGFDYVIRGLRLEEECGPVL